MPDFTDLISQAKKMQDKMKETQEALKKIEVEGISGGDAVKVIMNGDGELKKIFIGDALFALPPSFAQGASQSIEASKKLFDQIENSRDDYYKKRIKKLNSVNWRSKLNYYSFHVSNPIFASFRNSILKALVKNNKFLESYLGKIYRN